MLRGVPRAWQRVILADNIHEIALAQDHLEEPFASELVSSDFT
jgi:hypothetical protein